MNGLHSIPLNQGPCNKNILAFNWILNHFNHALSITTSPGNKNIEKCQYVQRSAFHSRTKEAFSEPRRLLKRNDMCFRDLSQGGSFYKISRKYQDFQILSKNLCRMSKLIVEDAHWADWPKRSTTKF